MKEFWKLLIHFKLKELFFAPTTNAVIQFFRYAFVGGIAAVVDWAVLFVLTKLGMHYLLSTVFAFITGLAVNFLLSKKLVFNAEQARVGRTAEFAVYAIIGVVGLGLTEAIMYLLTDRIGLYFMLSKIIATLIVLVWNYAARKLTLYRSHL